MEESKGTVSQSENVGDDKKDVVAYDTYRRTVSEVKSLKAKLAELEAERDHQSQQKLAEQGKYKEQAESLLKKLSEKDEQVKKVVTTFGQKVFESEAKGLALGLGARPDAIDDILKVGNWNDVEIDDSFNVNKEQLKLKIEELSKTKPWFFGGNPKAPESVIPGHASGKSFGKDLSKLSLDEIRELAKHIK
jgi:hypothetical protein